MLLKGQMLNVVQFILIISLLLDFGVPHLAIGHRLNYKVQIKFQFVLNFIFKSFNNVINILKQKANDGLRGLVN